MRRLVGNVEYMGEKGNAYRIIVAKPKGKIPLGRRRRRWEDNIKMDVIKLGFKRVDWFQLTRDRENVGLF
jgi:hypothetical protein